MAGVNKVILIGNLGADPEVRYTPGGQPVANFRIACSESWTDKEGQKQERTEWVRIVAWGKLGELCGEYLQKGRPVYVEGKLQTREWTDKGDRKQWSTEVVASGVTFLGSKDGGGAQGDDFGPPPSNDRPAQRGGGDTSGAVFPGYGRSKGRPVRGASRGDLEFYANGCRRTLDDPARERFHAQERALLAAIEAEMGGGSDTRGGPTSDDIPF